jgi:hypothetical protein
MKQGCENDGDKNAKLADHGTAGDLAKDHEARQQSEMLSQFR